MQFNRVTSRMLPPEASRVPVALIWLACCVVLATVVDTWVISDIPTLRTVAGALGVVLAGCWTLYRIRGIKIRRGAMVWMLVFLVTIVSVDVLRFLDAGSLAVNNSMQWLQVILFGFILFDICRDRRSAWYLFNALMLSIIALAVIGTFTGFREGVRSGTDLANLNTQAYYYAVIVVALYVFIVERWPQLSIANVVAALVMVFLLVSLLATGSRSAVLAIAVGIGTATGLLLRLRNKTAYVSLIPLLLVGGSLLVLSSGSAERWQRTLDGDDYGHRDIIWAASVEMIKQRPLLGHGANFVTDLGERTEISKISTHNQYLMLIIAYGLFGLLVWMAIIAAVIRRCWRYRKHPMAVALLAMIACSLIFGLAADLTFRRFFWVVIALAANVDIIVKTYPTNARLRDRLGDGPESIASTHHSSVALRK